VVSDDLAALAADAYIYGFALTFDLAAVPAGLAFFEQMRLGSPVLPGQVDDILACPVNQPAHVQPGP
jgi:hypothetical protein